MNDIRMELRMIEAVVTAGAVRRTKLQSNHHHQQTNIQFLQAGCPFCRPTNSVKALEGILFNCLFSRITPV